MMNTCAFACAAAVALCLLVMPAGMAAAPSAKAFPTAEGFGAKAVGGRGGRVIEVTNLDDSGDGSLRSAMEAPGPRVCVFRVSGTITLKSAIRVSAPYLTVAGQTSPGGVQIKGTGQPDGDWGVWCVNGAHDIILRHLRVRMGGNMKHDAGNNILFYGTAEPGVHDMIVDHCSVSWGSDTQLDWYGSYLDRATFQWNIIGECFMGQHVGGNRAPKNITLHHNLYANLGSRTPLMQHAEVFDFRNNVIYNWSGNNASVFGQFALNSSAFGNVVGNLWLAGPESGYPYLNVGNGGPTRIDGSAAEAGGTKLYLAGNWGPRCPTGSTNDWIGHGVNTWDYYEFKKDGSTHLVDQAQYSVETPFPAPPVTLHPVSLLLDKVLTTVGRRVVLGDLRPRHAGLRGRAEPHQQQHVPGRQVVLAVPAGLALRAARCGARRMHVERPGAAVPRLRAPGAHGGGAHQHHPAARRAHGDGARTSPRGVRRFPLREGGTDGGTRRPPGRRGRNDGRGPAT